MKRTWGQQFKSALAGMLIGILIPTLAMGQATLLPNAKQQYLDDAGNPVAGGEVDYFIPNTSTRKTIWSDAAKTTPLPNPVILDAAGRPQPTGQIYGDGSYRQRVVDTVTGLTIWDAVTASTGGGGSGSVAASEGVMVGTIIPWVNTTLPAKYLYTAGQAVSRVTYPDLLTAMTYQLTVLCQLGVATITVPVVVSDMVPLGAPVEFSCFAPGTVVASKASGSLTLSTNATVTSSVTGRILPWGNGDGSTTFNVPDLRGRTLVGRNNMNGINGTALSSLYYLNGSTPVDPNAVNAAAGNQSGTMRVSNLPPYTPTGTNTGGASNFQINQISNGSTGGAQNVVTSIVLSGGTTLINTNFTQPIFTGNAAPNGGVAASATVAAGGSAYTAGTQLLTVTGGTCTTQPQFNVTVAAGAITAPVLATPGLCTVAPTNPAATSGGGGTGGTLNVSYSAAPFSLVQPSITSDYIIKALPDDAPTTPGVTSIQGMTGAVACAGSLVCTGNTISVTVPANGVSSVGGMTGAIACGSGVTCGAGTISVTATAASAYASRAVALTQNLTGSTVVQTLGYATPGDGGGAVFKNVGSAPFLDSFVTSGTISNAGAGYTNGTYRSVFFQGGTGSNFIANVTVAGGVITVVTIINAGGFAYTVGDVITPTGGNGQIGGTGAGFTWTVGAVSTPLASFTDSAGNRWQYVQGDAIYAKQFGAKFDWLRTTGDAGATNDHASIQAALNYASYVNEFAINFVTNSLAGTAVVWPSGTAMICGAPLRQFSSTWARGQGPQNSMLKMCDTGIGAAENFYTVCDERAQLACFGGQISDFGLVALIAAPGNSGTYMLYSNAAQQQRFISNISIYSGTRGCFRYDTGYGGAAIVGIYDYFCTVASGNTQTAANVVNATSTMFTFMNGVIESSSYTGFGITFLAGMSKFVSYHFEGITTGINVQMTVATDKLTVDNVTGGSNCLEMVRLQSTNTLNNFSITQTHKQGVCVNLVLNGQPAGANRATDVAPGVFVNFNP